MWELYDELIKDLPRDVYPSRLYQSGHCTLAEFDGMVGATVTNCQSNIRPLISGYSENETGFSLAGVDKYKELSWHEMGRLIKSWNFKEASFGAAAINAYYNQPEKIKEIIDSDKDIKINDNVDPFSELEEMGRGKIIATIGHFGTKRPCFDTAKKLKILEINQKKGDYPDSACEYVLEDADIVIITGFTFINKTLPRLLELSKNSKVIFLGPSCTISDVLFKYGVSDIASSIFDDFDSVKQRARTRTHKILVKIGNEVRLTRQ